MFQTMKSKAFNQTERESAFSNAFRPFQNVQELRHCIQQPSKGTTGRLTTIDEVAALDDD